MNQNNGLGIKLSFDVVKWTKLAIFAFNVPIIGFDRYSNIFQYLVFIGVLMILNLFLYMYFTSLSKTNVW